MANVHRHGLRFRPTLDRLEGRALMAFAGTPDPSFGVSFGTFPSTYPGIVLELTAPGPTTGLVSLSRTAVEADGSIVAAGPVGTSEATIGLIKINANGTPDPNFGVNGEADVVMPAGVTAYGGGPTGLLVQPDGKIVVVDTAISGGNARDATVVARFLADGSPDPSFGQAGVVVLDQTNLGVGSVFLQLPALQADGKLVLTGSSVVPSGGPLVGTQQITVARIDQAGALDPSFGTGGVVTFPGDVPAGSSFYSDNPIGLAIQPDGRIVVLAEQALGGGTPRYLLGRLNPNGSVDPSLRDPGLLAYGEGADSLAVQADGKLIIEGNTTLARLNADGSFEKSLGLPVPTSQGLAIQSDGKIDLFAANSSVIRVTPGLTLDATFGIGGVAKVSFPRYSTPPNGPVPAPIQAEALAVGPDGRVVLAGSNFASTAMPASQQPASLLGFARLTATGTSARPGDYTGDGIADEALYDPSTGTFAVRSSTNGLIVTEQFGSAGLNASIPVPGNYYGSGKDDLAVYLTGSGTFAIKDPSGNTPGQIVQFGSAGYGNSIPVPGDFYGTGKDDLAVYLVGPGAFAIQDPTGQTPGKIVQFGTPGLYGSIPVPGDYYGTGRTDIAVYLPQQGVWAIQDPTGKTPGQEIPFGKPGQGESIPVPGDYDGSGKTELAVYLPQSARLIYRPANGGADVTIPFGSPGTGVTLPAPGDYTGSGKTDVAAYLPALGLFAYRPANGGPDVYTQFGTVITGTAVPVTAVVPPFMLIAYDRVGAPVAPSGVLGTPDLLDFVPTEASTLKKLKG
jgi:uncharacterized delta-60 repeat protein